MGTGQTLITMLAMVLLSFLILRTNNLFFQTTTTLNTTKFDVLAFSLAESMIQEIEANAFDQNSGVVFNIKCKVDYVLSTAPDVPTSTKSWNKLITVYITSPFMTQVALTNQYYLKVKSTTQVIQDTVKLAQVFSYWNFK